MHTAPEELSGVELYAWLDANYDKLDLTELGMEEADRLNAILDDYLYTDEGDLITDENSIPGNVKDFIIKLYREHYKL